MASFKYLTHKHCRQIGNGNGVDPETSYVGTYSDILFIGDEIKSNSTFEKYIDFQKALQNGNIFLVELDEFWFLKNAFDEDSQGDFYLDTNVNCFKRSPLFTCNYLSLKTNCDYAYWDNEILEECIQNF